MCVYSFSAYKSCEFLENVVTFFFPFYKTRMYSSASRGMTSVVPLRRASSSLGRVGRAMNSNTSGKKVVVASSSVKEDEVYRVMSKNQELSVIAVTATKLVAEAQQRHKSAPTATAAIGRNLIASLLLGTFKGDDESVQLTFRGDGPLGQLTAVSDNMGNTKCLVGNAQADPPLRPDGKLNVGMAVGKGILSVTRSHPSWVQPYNGQVNIYTGEIAEDVAVYMRDSEQTNSAVSVGVQLDRDLTVVGAGGYMVQVLPFASDETLDYLEKHIPTLDSPSTMVESGMSAEEIAKAILGDLGAFEEVETRLTPKYGPCSRTDLEGRMLKAIASLGREEAMKIIEEDGKIEITCEFCKEDLVFSEADIEKALQEI
jgi:molecular chaperone Hsp33